MKRVPVIAALVACVVAGCGLVAGIEETTTVGPDAASSDAPDASVDDLVDSGPQVTPDPGGDDGDVLGSDDVKDAGVDSGVLACPKASVFVPSLSGVVSEVCNPSGGLVQGGEITGLDAFGAGVDTSKDGVAVTACVGFDFGAGAKLDVATIRLFAIDKGCQYTCYSGGCDNTATARAFVGTDRTFRNWTKAGFAKVDGTRANYTFAIPSGDFHVVAICRSGHGAEQEDLGVDGISATCR